MQDATCFESKRKVVTLILYQLTDGHDHRQTNTDQGYTNTTPIDTAINKTNRATNGALHTTPKLILATIIVMVSKCTLTSLYWVCRCNRYSMVT